MTSWQDVRQQFPVTKTSTYLNSAAAGPLAIATQQAAARYYEQMAQDGDIHWDEWLAKREEVRAKVASFINADPDEIALTTNTSSGMNIIIDALEGRGEVISSDLEFPVTTIPWMYRHIPVHLVKSVEGEVRTEDLQRQMNERTGIVSLSYVQFSNGFRTQLEELAQVKGRHVLVVNASQAAGVLEIDVQRMKIDALCSTGHKWLCSGYGSGFVYLSKELMSQSRPRAIGWLSVNEPYAMKNDEIRLRHDASARIELGCPHFAGIFALGASIDLMQTIGISSIEQRALELNRYLTDSLEAIGWRVLSSLREESYRSAETLVVASSPAELTAVLAAKKILVTEKPQGIRIATHFFNDESDVDALVDELGRLSRHAVVD